MQGIFLILDCFGQFGAYKPLLPRNKSREFPETSSREFANPFACLQGFQIDEHGIL
jgi:hypothetical protein